MSLGIPRFTVVAYPTLGYANRHTLTNPEGPRKRESVVDENELAVVRRGLGKQALAAVGVENPRLEEAFATVKREDFLGPGPWKIFRWGQTYRQTPSADPVYL